MSAQLLQRPLQLDLVRPEPQDFYFIRRLLLSQQSFLFLHPLPIALVSLDDLVQVPDLRVLVGLLVKTVGDLDLLVSELGSESLVLLLELVRPEINSFELLPQLVGVVDLLLESPVRAEVVLLFLVLGGMLDSAQDL